MNTSFYFIDIIELDISTQNIPQEMLYTWYVFIRHQIPISNYIDRHQLSFTVNSKSFELSSPFLWPCVHTYQCILPLRSYIWCNILTHLWLCTRVFCLETKARNKYTPLKCSSSHLCPCQLINKSLVGQEFADKVDPN